MGSMNIFDIKNLPERELELFDNTENFCPDNFAGENYPVPAVTKDTVVWGGHIIRAAAEAGLEKIWCRETDSDPLQMLKTALLLENRKNGYSFAEKKRILDFAVKVCPEGCPKEIAALVQDEGDFTTLTEKYSSLSPVLRKGIDEGLIDIKSALSLSDTDDRCLEILFAAKERISYSSRRIILREFTEICRRDRLDADDRVKLMEAIAGSENPGAFTARLRNPKMEEMKKSFAGYNEKYIKGSGLILEAPQNFEGNSYTVRFQLKSKNQLERIIKTLGKVKESAEELFKLL